jgi:hypothetical protein
MLLSGCGGSNSSESSLRDFNLYTLPIPWPPIKKEVTLHPKPNGLVGRELKAVIPDRPPPQVLYGQYWVEGIGPGAHRGDKLTLEMVGVDYATGKKFYSSWDEGKPLTFTLGRGKLIKGLEHWIPGMEVGDECEVIVPPKLAEGAERLWGAPPDATLVFVMRLLDVKYPDESL